MAINQAGKWEKICRNIYQKVDLFFEARKARKSCRRQLSALKGGYRGSNALFRSQVLPFWERYGIKPKKMWYDLYCYKDGRYDPRYIPGDLYWKKIYPSLNNPGFRRAYTDKCFYSQLFPYLKQPRTILKNINNCFFDGRSGKAISFQQAKSILESVERFVIKPSIYSGEGADIFFYEKNDARDIDIESLMKSYRSNFIVQEVLTQHKVLASIHPESLNTIRVISFLFQGEVHISSSILRIGVEGSRFDNVSKGGLACPILPDGRLGKEAVNGKSQWVTSHPGGTVFSEVIVPSYERVLNAIRRAHKDVPHFRIIGWDFSIDEGGEPVFIEYNGAPGLNQVSCGPLFGDLTEPVLNMIFLNENEFSNRN
ncbi:MAG TPA: hexapeptide transferase [Ruminiclostridium sp.]|nr:hexapeptide transferase [Clostridiaceae bacterium]HAA25571.1 hexapeptide transferase [Ruminiclostridium sp.]